MADKLHEYRGKDIIVRWSSRRCIHVAECIRGLGIVFDTRRVPWVTPDSASADKVAEVVMCCPTGALHFERIADGSREPVPDSNSVEVVPHGALYFRGNIDVLNRNGEVVLTDTRVALCRCGGSDNKPFCDGSHRQRKFRHFLLPSEMVPSPEPVEDSGGKLTVEPLLNGPLLVTGNFQVRNSAGEVVTITKDRSLCRCGNSGTKPFCDGSHKRVGFESEAEMKPTK